MTFFLNEEQNKYILELYKRTNKSPSKAIELFEKKYGFRISRTTITHKWREEGYELNQHGGLRQGLGEKQLRELYEKYDGDVGAMSDEAEEGVKSLIALCRRYDLEPKKVPKGAYSGNPSKRDQKYIDHFFI